MTTRTHLVLVAGFVFALVFPADRVAKAQAGNANGSTFPTTNNVTFLGAGIGDDGLGPYVDGEDCVSGTGGSQGGGVSHLRTLDNNEAACRAVTRDNWRYLTLDFGTSAPGDLDGDGAADTTPNKEQVAARWSINSPFKPDPQIIRIVIWVMGVDDKGTPDPLDDTITEEGKAWRLEYQDEGSATVNPDGSRTILPGGLALADLYETVFTVRGNKVRRSEEHRGTFGMPFHLDVAPQ